MPRLTNNTQKRFATDVVGCALNPVRRLPIRNDSKSRNHLLQWVSLEPARRIDALRKERSVLHGIVYTTKHAARHAEPTIKVTLVVDR